MSVMGGDTEPEQKRSPTKVDTIEKAFAAMTEAQWRQTYRVVLALGENEQDMRDTMRNANTPQDPAKWRKTTKYKAMLDIKVEADIDEEEELENSIDNIPFASQLDRRTAMMQQEETKDQPTKYQSVSKILDKNEDRQTTLKNRLKEAHMDRRRR